MTTTTPEVLWSWNVDLQRVRRTCVRGVVAGRMPSCRLKQDALTLRAPTVVSSSRSTDEPSVCKADIANAQDGSAPKAQLYWPASSVRRNAVSDGLHADTNVWRQHSRGATGAEDRTFKRGLFDNVRSVKVSPGQSGAVADKQKPGSGAARKREFATFHPLWHSGPCQSPGRPREIEDHAG